MTYSEEKWAPVKGYEGVYEVSNYGRVRSSRDKTTKSSLHGKRKWRQRVLKQKFSEDSGSRVDLWLNKVPTAFLVHRLVAEAFIPKEEGKEFINHIDGNRLNNKEENLEWVTYQENSEHAFKHGLMPTNQFVILEDLTTGELHKFTSMTKASKFVGRYSGYIGSTVDRGEFIVDHFAIYLTAMPNLERVRHINDRISRESE